MLLDKYASIDEIINKDQKTMLLVIEICDSLCNSDTNLKEIAQLVSKFHNTFFKIASN